MVGLHGIIATVWWRSKGPQTWIYAVIKVVYEKNDRAECDNYRGISRVTHADTVLPKCCLWSYRLHCREAHSSRGAARFPPSETDSLHVASNAPATAAWVEPKVFSISCVSSACKRRTTPPCELVWVVSDGFGVPEKMIEVIPEFHHGMRACVRFGDRKWPDWFEIEQGFREGCVLAVLLFSISLASVRRRLSYGVESRATIHP